MTEPPAVTAALGRCLAVAAVALVLAVATGRPELVLLAAPFVLAPVRALAGRAPAVDRAGLTLEPGPGGELVAAVELRSATDLDLVVLALHGRPEQRAPRPHLTALLAGAATTVRLPVGITRWGRHTVGPATARPLGAHLLVHGEVAATGTATAAVAPGTEPFDAAAALLPSSRRPGLHRARASGPGVEPVAVRAYAAGDRLRQVDWRTTSRTGALHVRATSTDWAADVVVVLDALADPGPPGGTVLDTAVRAASGIVEHHLALGDSVGLVQFGGRLRTLRAGSGRRQGARARDWLLDVRPPTTRAVARATQLWVPTARSSGSLVVVLTPLLDERTTTLLADLRRRGSSVVAVDVLPRGAVPVSPPGSAGELAWRLWLLERQASVARLAELGVPVVAWSGVGSLDAVLVPLARLAGAPRAVRS